MFDVIAGKRAKRNEARGKTRADVLDTFEKDLARIEEKRDNSLRKLDEQEDKDSISETQEVLAAIEVMASGSQNEDKPDRPRKNAKTA